MFEEVNLDNVLEETTQPRQESDTNEPHFEPGKMPSFEGLEFEQEEPKEVEIVKEPEEPYNAEENADLLIGLLSGANILLTTPLARWKSKQKRGGKKVIAKLQTVYAKHYAGEKLTDEEKAKLELYQAYLQDKKELESAIPYTDKEIAALKMTAVPYLQATKMKINGGLAFWMQLGTMQVTRIMTILTA